MKFEKALKRLEDILQEIENKDLDVDKLIDLFEEGNNIASTCQKDLIKAQSKMKLIIKQNDKIKTEDIK